MKKPQSQSQPPIYQPATLEFATVAREYCILLDNAERYSRSDFVRVAARMFALLYLKASLLPAAEAAEVGWQPEVVDEREYERVRRQVSRRMARFDDYVEVFHEDFAQSDGPVAASISEDMADVYQDIRDFCEGYHSGDDAAMTEALRVVAEHFRDYWGQRLCNGLRALHQVLYGPDDLDEEEGTPLRNDHDEEDDPAPTPPSGAGVADQPYFLGKMGMRLTGGPAKGDDDES